ncbi:MAG: cation transporter, partial [Candidatus Thermoplasmatota archaeon]|nr:cation transporter [Candidatus Thermoplasmatota archaeon]
MSETVTLDVGGMTCDGCAGRVRNALEGVTGVTSAEVSHESGSAIVSHSGVSRDLMTGAVRAIGYTVDGQAEEFHWGDSSVWRQSAHNTKWCLVGCSIGDFGTIAAFQFIPYLDALGWSTMSIMLLAMFNGIMTSIALETIILS